MMPCAGGCDQIQAALMCNQQISQCYAVFFPALLLCLRVFGGGKTVQEKQWWLLVVLLQPAALLIDHGHFQYNNISLGFAVRHHCLP
jgi:hypothetical protein